MKLKKGNDKILDIIMLRDLPSQFVIRLLRLGRVLESYYIYALVSPLFVVFVFFLLFYDYNDFFLFA
jgi:hypothetical protein